MSGPEAEIRPGNCLPISNIPVGTLIHNIEVREGKGAQLVRSAGGAAQLLAKEGDFAQLRMPSGEVRLIHQVCYATIGQVGNLDHSNIKLGKAGRKRHQSVLMAPKARGVNPPWVRRHVATRRRTSILCAVAVRRTDKNKRGTQICPVH